MEILIYDIKQTCNEWMLKNGFKDQLFETSDKNEICFLIHRMKRLPKTSDSLVFENVNGELTQNQKNFIQILCTKHDLFYDFFKGQHLLIQNLNLDFLSDYDLGLRKV